MPPESFNLFQHPEFSEVPLRHNALRFVVCQVVFPKILKIEDPAQIAPFQDAIRIHYPVFGNEMHPVFELDGGPPTAAFARLWRFSDAHEQWTFTLSQNFIALAATSYTSRDEFLKRLGFLIGVTTEILSPSYVNKIGVRYVNQFKVASIDETDDVFRENFLSVYNSLNHGEHDYSITDTLIRGPHEILRAKWGVLPKNATHDPNLTSIDSPSLFLDLDTSQTLQADELAFSSDALLPKIESLSKTCYKFFRWSISPNQLEKMRS